MQATVTESNGAAEKSSALMLLSSERPRNVNWFQAGSLLFGDWGTSRLYVLGLAFAVAGRTSFWLISAMSILIVIVAWAYTQICRLYPDGGGVYSAARQRSKLLGVIGALLLFADYTVTASLSSLDAFHYFGLGAHHAEVAAEPDAGDHIVHPEESGAGEKLEGKWTLKSPVLWGIVSILVIGALNLLGPKHTAGFALAAAAGMIVITAGLVVCALPQIHWSQLHFGSLHQRPVDMWEGFVAIVLALSGVEAIANLTGVMHRPVYKTAKKSIWLVAAEVAIFNLLLAVAMCSISPLGREGHKEDMLAFMARYFVGPWGEWPVRILGGLLLLSATNTAVGALMGTLYVMSRDGELPPFLQKLNSFGAPWIGAIIAAGVPALVLVFVSEISALAHLYAIGIVGAVAISCTVSAFHPRLRRLWRKGPMVMIGLLLIAIWITLALTKGQAVVFVAIVLTVGLSARALTRYMQKRHPKPSLLRQAIMDQLTSEGLAKPKILLATAGSDALAPAAIEVARLENASLVVCFIREVALNFLVEAEGRLTLENDPAAQALFIDFLDHGYKHGVTIIPAYDTGTNSTELLAELAAINGVQKVLIGSSRRGTLHQMIKGSFQQKLESLLPEEIPVQVLSLDPSSTTPPARAA